MIPRQVAVEYKVDRAGPDVEREQLNRILEEIKRQIANLGGDVNYVTQQQLQDALDTIVFPPSGGGIVETIVEGFAISVDATDPANPEVSVVPVDLISSDANNQLVIGVDGGLFVPASSGGITSIAPGDGIDVDATDPDNPEVSAKISTDASNALSIGTDGGLYATGGGGGAPYLTGIFPEAAVDAPYSFSLTLNNPGSTAFWEITDGALPIGLAIDADDGEVAGSPSGSGQYNFEIAATIASGTGAGATSYSRQLLNVIGVGKTPLEIAGCTTWYDGTDISFMYQDSAGLVPVTGGGQECERWYSKTGSGSGVSSVPANVLWQDNVVNSLGVVRYGQAYHDTLSPLSTFIANNAFTIVVCMYVTGVTETGSTYSTAYPVLRDTSNYIGLNVSNSPARIFGYNYDGSEDYASTNQAQGAWVVMSFQHIGGNIRIRVNRGAWTTVASGNTGSLANHVYFGNTRGLVAGTLDLQNLATFNVAISDSDLNDLEDYFADRAGISL